MAGQSYASTPSRIGASAGPTLPHAKPQSIIGAIGGLAKTPRKKAKKKARKKAMRRY